MQIIFNPLLTSSFSQFIKSLPPRIVLVATAAISLFVASSLIFKMKNYFFTARLADTSKLNQTINQIGKSHLKINSIENLSDDQAKKNELVSSQREPSIEHSDLPSEKEEKKASFEKNESETPELSNEEVDLDKTWNRLSLPAKIEWQNQLQYLIDDIESEKTLETPTECTRHDFCTREFQGHGKHAIKLKSTLLSDVRKTTYLKSGLAKHFKNEIEIKDLKDGFLIDFNKHN